MLDFNSFASTMSLSCAGMSSLWVDDKPEQIARLQTLLFNYGIAVTVVDTYERAQAAVRDNPYDLILVDLVLDGEHDGIGISRYARRILDTVHRRATHFGVVTNFRDQLGRQSEEELFEFVYEKEHLKNGKSKQFAEDCMFSAADARLRAESPAINDERCPRGLTPDQARFVRCDIGVVLGVEGGDAWVRLWRRSKPKERTIRVFDRGFLARQGVKEVGQPLRIDMYESIEDGAQWTLLTAVGDASDRVRQRIAEDVDLELFRDDRNDGQIADSSI